MQKHIRLEANLVVDVWSMSDLSVDPPTDATGWIDVSNHPNVGLIELDSAYDPGTDTFSAPS